MSSAYNDHLTGAGHTVSEEEVQEMAKQKAHELFSVCDIEQKGFITKRDMQRLQNELPLQPDQLEAVFDSLDDDGNGYLTLEEFTEGFGAYLGINFMGESQMDGDDTLENIYEGEEDRLEEEKQFSDMMENIGARSLFEDENTIKHLWIRMRKDEPEMVGNFEDFLYKISTDLRKTKVDFDTLENALKSKSTAHDEEVQKLYEEMEYQIKKEKERILSEEQLKERQIREALERDLQEKDRQLQELLNKHQEMEQRLEMLNQVESETKQENEKLAKEKDELEDMLLKSQEGLEDSKMYIDQLRQQQKKEKQERARAAIKLTESIALERESLVKQLDTLKDVNKKLRDDKDEAEIRRDVTTGSEGDNLEQILEAEASRDVQSKSSRKKELFKQGSILGDYFPGSRRKFESTAESIEESVDIESDEGHGISDDDIECDDDDMIAQNNNNLNSNNINYGDSDNLIKPSYYGNFDKSAGSDVSDEEDGTKKSRSKARKKAHKKKHSMQTKGRVAPSSGGGIDDSFEESGDNIDVIVAPDLEDDLTSKGENLSLYFENVSEKEPVEMLSAEVQTIEEMVPKSELEALKTTSGVDSSTNTEELELENEQENEIENNTVSVDCSTNTEALEPDIEEENRTLSVDCSTNTDILAPENDIENEKKLANKAVSIDCSTNTDLEPVEEVVPTESVEISTNTEDLEEFQSKPVPTLTEMATSTEPEFLEPVEESGSHSKPVGIEIATNTEDDMFEPVPLNREQGQGTSAIADGLDKTKSVLNNNELSESIRSEMRKPRREFKLQRNDKIRDENDENLMDMTPKVTVSSNVLYFKSSNVKPLPSPANERPDDQEEIVQGTRGQPVGADGETDLKGIESTVGMRQRIFKVVFVGDSGVGKSSFIHRFCNDNFNPTFSATIGVDFQVKSLILGGQHIVLQLWDTAGQERFRSITKQYFRKADGVVIMYDVNCESTFTNVRNWMESVQEGVEEGTVVLLIGNKTDMAETEADRAVKTKDGNKLSVEYDGIFFETSAKAGNNVKESMEALANILKEKEDKEIEKALNLDENAVKKKFCCG